MHISEESVILERRIYYQIGFGGKPYTGKIYYKISEWERSSGATISFYTKQSGLKAPSKYEIQMKFEMDFPGYRVINISIVHIPTTNQTVYITYIGNNESIWTRPDEINKMLINHPDYELNDDGFVII